MSQNPQKPSSGAGATAPSALPAPTQVAGIPVGPRRNAKGGVLVTPAEIRQTIEFFDTDGKGYITLQDLRDKLGIFYSRLTSMDFKFLMNGKTELTEHDLAQLLSNNELTDFDPVREAFKVYSPEEDFMDPTILKNILANLGFHDIKDDDVEVLMRAMDFDQDGEVSLDDFRLIAQSGISGTGTASGSTTGAAAAASAGSSTAPKPLSRASTARPSMGVKPSTTQPSLARKPTTSFTGPVSSRR